MRWAPVKKFEGIYQVSDTGRLRRIKCPGGGSYEIMGTNSYGYRIVYLSNGWKHGYSWRGAIHRLIVEAFIGPIPEGMHVNHKNGIRDDNRLSNLEICTPKQNVYHALGLSDQRRTYTVPLAEAARLLRLSITVASKLVARGYLRHRSISCPAGTMLCARQSDIERLNSFLPKKRKRGYSILWHLRKAKAPRYLTRETRRREKDHLIEMLHVWTKGLTNYGRRQTFRSHGLKYTTPT